MHEPLSHRSAGTNTLAAPHHILHRDFKSRSRLDLRKVGAHKYAAHPSTEVICCAYAVDDGPTKIWIPVIRRRRNLMRPHSILIGRQPRTGTILI